jgi:hypothetical protein
VRDERKLRIVVLIVSLAIGLFGLWKRSQDLEDLAFVQEQVRRAGAEAPVPSPAMQRRLDQDHRNALLAISEKERELRELGSAGPTVTSLQDNISQDVQQVLLSASSGFRSTDTVWYQFEDSRVHEVRRALAIDLLLFPLSLAGLIWSAVLWSKGWKRP